MRSPTGAADRLASVLNRKSPEEAEKLVGQMLESGRRAAYARQADAAEAEAKILLAAAEKGGELFVDRASRAAAALLSDTAFAASVLEIAGKVARPHPDGLMVSGLVTAGEDQPSNGAVVVFLTTDGREIEGAPEFKAGPGGRVDAALSAHDLKRLAGATGEGGAVLFGLKIGARVVATTMRPLRLKPGAVLQFSLEIGRC